MSKNNKQLELHMNLYSISMIPSITYPFKHSYHIQQILLPTQRKRKREKIAEKVIINTYGAFFFFFFSFNSPILNAKYRMNYEFECKFPFFHIQCSSSATNICFAVHSIVFDSNPENALLSIYLLLLLLLYIEQWLFVIICIEFIVIFSHILYDVLKSRVALHLWPSISYTIYHIMIYLCCSCSSQVTS